MPSSELGLKGGYLDVAPSYYDLKEFLISNGCIITGERAGGIIDCFVPTQLIDHEEVPVKEEWAAALAEQMREIANTDGGTGQQTAITAALVNNESLIKIIDGFHRDAAMTINDEPMRFLSITAKTWDDLFTQRIFTAKDHAHVRFSRVVHWIRQAWQYSGVSDKMSIEQAIVLFRFKTSGSKLKLDPADVGLAKAWVERKQHQWGLAAMTIHSHLKIAEHVDPRLVHATREKKKGNALDAPTQSILVMFSEQLADRYDLQNAVMEVAMARNLKSAEIRAVCTRIASCPSYLAAQEIIAEINWDELKPEYKETKLRALRRRFDARHNGGAVLDAAADNIASALARARQSEERAEEVTDEMLLQIDAAKLRVSQLIRQLGLLGTKLDDLKARAPSDVEARLSEHFKPTKHPSLDDTVTSTERKGSGIRDEEAIRASICEYVTGATDDKPQRYTRKDLLKVHPAISAAPDKVSTWGDRFKELAEAVANPAS